MFVLNTNEQKGGGYELSNQDICVPYPQAKNNILLFPDNCEVKMNAMPTAVSVNGTVINAISGIMIFPSDLTTNQPLINSSNLTLHPPVNYIQSYNNSNIFRIGLPIKSGLTIGKTIIIPALYLRYGSNTADKSFNCNVGLLHADGTITTMASKAQETNYKTSSGYSHLSIDGRETAPSNGVPTRLIGEDTIVNTNGYTTAEGDYIIAEYQFVNQAGNPYLTFGCHYPTKDNEKIKPVQVSID